MAENARGVKVVLCSHEQDAKRCKMEKHTDDRYCPVHGVGWDSTEEDGCWAEDECDVTPKIGSPLRLYRAVHQAD